MLSILPLDVSTEGRKMPSMILCLMVLGCIQQQAYGQGNSFNPCKIRRPLRNDLNYCGRGGQECPKGYHCVVDPADRYAACCQDELPCDQGQGSKTVMCGRDRSCPPGSHCVDDPGKEYSVCCRGNPGACSQKEKDTCLESCLAQGLNAIEGAECNGCPCIHPCAAVLCFTGTVCLGVEGTCNRPICPLEPRCVPICELPIEPGRCRAYIPRWAFDADLNICREFIYGGCGGNANNFETFEACRDSCHNCPQLRCLECENGNTQDLRGCRGCGCRDTCDLPQDVGECAKGEEPVTRYWHNPESRQCERFRGCDGGNANSFTDFNDCFNTCEPCPVVDCIPGFVPCELRGLVSKKTRDGCDTCSCLDYGEVCAMAADPGPCTDYAQRFYFNPDSGSCEPFIFGGCVGNANNFATKEECEGKCDNGCTEAEKDACLESCLAQNMNSVPGEECNGCPCFDPCIAATCPIGTVCTPVPVICIDPPCTLGTECVQPCSEAEKDACLESCLAQNMNSVPGEECNGCPCFDPCIAATCLIGTVCTPVPVLCIDPPCTLGVECVPICELPIEMGPCEAAIKRWAFDADLNICREFIYGGCGGNANNFETFEACRDSCHNCPRLLCPECLNGNTKDLRGCRDCGCTETCDLPQDLGECAEGEEPVTRYWHNPESRLCDRYEGCDGGNANSFIDAVDCFETCNVCPQILCTPDFVPCALRGLVPKKTEEGCDTCQCIDYSEVCAMAADPGPCTDYAQRFYFNPDSGSCEPFIFGGCVGNANNFATKEECEGKCNNPCTLEQMDACLESCLAQNMNAVLGEECNGCPCIDPCIAATCPEGTVCLPVPLQCFRAPCPLGVDCVPVLVPN